MGPNYPWQLIVTPRPTDSTGEFEDCSDEVEELCRSELKKCLRVPEEQAPLKGLDLTYTEHPVKNLETSERVTWNKCLKMCRVQWSHHSEAEATWEREDELRKTYKTYPDLFASQPS